MKYIVSLLFFVSVQFAFSQDIYDDIKKFQEELNAEFLNPEKSPLTKKEQRKFKGHNFFPIDSNYRVKAQFIKLEKTETLKMKTTTSRLPSYDKYGIVKFELNSKQYQLAVYQSHRLRETEEYKTYLFLPFTDLTNGFDSYGGGRYIDLNIPKGNEIIIDFNKAYSPSCAYNHSYSCPIPPAENNLEIKIKAGVKNLKL